MLHFKFICAGRGQEKNAHPTRNRPDLACAGYHENLETVMRSDPTCVLFFILNVYFIIYFLLLSKTCIMSFSEFFLDIILTYGLSVIARIHRAQL